ncbi:hypothetical protein [Moraxella catarrhalis]|uniref:hypothetical protein n=1 Tax=Moraxella catarrhalis TaxID=480 RepID=UPI00071EAA8F|nr:hypothetical protein [Moraxella catarrhalis]AKI27330.1 hypothetical protein [Moraxella phage Mcat7]MPX83871.1 hypothetical protein [Moraxella catarrhalis]
MLDDKEIIKKLGGVNVVSKYLDVRYTTVYNWLERGIPAHIKVKHPDIFMPSDIEQLKPLKVNNEQQTPIS